MSKSQFERALARPPWVLCAVLLMPLAASSAMVLAPKPMDSNPGEGHFSASFVQIASNWKGSTVLWDEPNKTYGSGKPIGDFDWGDGIWGMADWATVWDVANGTGSTADGAPRIILKELDRKVESINFGNAAYNAAHSNIWGPAKLLPIFSGTVGEYQDNWITYFTGEIKITQAGRYDFSVLNDDGFFLRLIGKDSFVETSRDFLNPRDRSGFADDLLLTPGLYEFELGMWNRLEAGVVDFRWSSDGGVTWDLVKSNEVPQARPISAPSTLSIALLAVILLFAGRGRNLIDTVRFWR